MPKVQHADAPFFLKCNQAFCHCRIGVAVIPASRIENNRAAPGFTNVGDDGFDRACDRVCVEVRTFESVGNLAERLVLARIVGGKLHDNEAVRCCRVNLRQQAMDIGAVAVVRQGRTADSFFRYAAPEPGREILRYTFLQRRRAIGDGGADKQNVLSFERAVGHRFHCLHAVCFRVSGQLRHADVAERPKRSEAEPVSDKQPLQQQKYRNADDNPHDSFPLFCHNSSLTF